MRGRIGILKPHHGHKDTRYFEKNERHVGTIGKLAETQRTTVGSYLSLLHLGPEPRDLLEAAVLKPSVDLRQTEHGTRTIGGVCAVRCDALTIKIV